MNHSRVNPPTTHRRGTLRIGNKRSDSKILPRPGETVIDGDRKNPILGNRHILHNHNDPLERARVIEAFRVDLENDWAKHGPLTQEIHKLADRLAEGENIILMCWCSPRPCHCDHTKLKIEE